MRELTPSIKSSIAVRASSSSGSWQRPVDKGYLTRLVYFSGLAPAARILIDNYYSLGVSKAQSLLLAPYSVTLSSASASPVCASEAASFVRQPHLGYDPQVLHHHQHTDNHSRGAAEFGSASGYDTTAALCRQRIGQRIDERLYIQSRLDTATSQSQQSRGGSVQHSIRRRVNRR